MTQAQIDARGIGNPDFSTIIERTQYDPTAQTPWYYNFAVSLPPGWTTVYEIYQIPTGRQLTYGFLSATASVDGLYRAIFTVDSVDRYSLILYGSGSWSLSEAAWIFTEDEWLGARIYNPHPFYIDFWAAPSGYLYDTGAR